MNYRSVLVLHTIQDSFQSLKAALLLANRWNVHIDLCILSAPVSTKILTTVNGVDDNFGVVAREDIARTDDRLMKIREFTEKHKISISLANHYTIEGNSEELLAKSVLYADLVIMSHSSILASGLPRKYLNTVLLEASKPVLLMAPQTLLGSNHDQSHAIEHIAIAWHEDAHSLRAIREAFPLLEMAKKVDLVLIMNGSNKHFDTRESRDFVSAIETYLDRHSLSVDVTAVPTDGRFVSHALLDTISNLNPDLVVMGAFGHTPIAEKMFHGVTYDVLESLVDTDLFLSHA